jgi:hypothetical protein
MRRVVPLLSLLFACLAFAPAAHAATVAVAYDSDTRYLRVTGGPEADALTISSPASGTYVVMQGAGRPLSAEGGSCFLTGIGRVTCVSAGLEGVMATGEGGDDIIAVHGAVGRGSLLRGGPGKDSLTGGTAVDYLYGDDGDDLLIARDSERDMLDCGRDRDTYDADARDDVRAGCETLRAADPVPVVSPGPPSTSPAPSAPGAPGPAAPQADVATGPVTMSAGGLVPMRISCPTGAAAACKGWITIRLLGRAERASAAAKKPGGVIARKRYTVRAGRTKAVKVHISRRGRARSW